MEVHVCPLLKSLITRPVMYCACAVSENIHSHPMEGGGGGGGGGWVLKAKILKGMYEAYWNLGFGGFKTNNLLWEGYGYFLKQH